MRRRPAITMRPRTIAAAPARRSGTVLEPVRGREAEGAAAGAAVPPGAADVGVPEVGWGTVVVAPGVVVGGGVAASTVMVPDMPTPPGAPWILQ